MCRRWRPRGGILSSCSVVATARTPVPLRNKGGCTGAGRRASSSTATLACAGGGRRWRPRLLLLDGWWPFSGSEDDGWRICLPPSTASGGGGGSGAWRRIRGPAPTYVPQCLLLRPSGRTSLQACKADVQRWILVKLGCDGSSPPFLRVFVSAAPDSGG